MGFSALLPEPRLEEAAHTCWGVHARGALRGAGVCAQHKLVDGRQEPVPGRGLPGGGRAVVRHRPQLRHRALHWLLRRTAAAKVRPPLHGNDAAFLLAAGHVHATAAPITEAGLPQLLDRAGMY